MELDRVRQTPGGLRRSATVTGGLAPFRLDYRGGLRRIAFIGPWD